MIDGFTSIILASTLDIGVLLSALPVFLYQGSIAFFDNIKHQFLSDLLLKILIPELTATGGVLIFALGIHMLGGEFITIILLLQFIMQCFFRMEVMGSELRYLIMILNLFLK
jgi:uncharacterized protein